jgi:hypothetical protein
MALVLAPMVERHPNVRDGRVLQREAVLHDTDTGVHLVPLPVRVRVELVDHGVDTFPSRYVHPILGVEPLWVLEIVSECPTRTNPLSRCVARTQGSAPDRVA